MTMPTKKQPTFKQAFEELEKIAETFERDDVDLESGLKDFERGLELAQICKQHIQTLEVRVKEIREKFNV
ncbi:exodeoxyribonuclease VII small subunit [Candidatus Uhrbacteria bacterium CG10_big_fil_rev_8_21_14_0_10_50_16]|uniref:Exodeoxyribonuclease 7 small subunit n=1 Tax=Candidatus Uhrbacteria bacterium CG10_big_fil_rev_8_21_14_0_10_50_16 TaxID=1975039 RepID=A0A2H0RQ15_9BACT|nr:MAG: exodeoxyribonuclease VII small subunit [Candidatus Uhrbacteria bacterium CG10_big_fil_rev_8_21_14_0_10_50_16]